MKKKRILIVIGIIICVCIAVIVIIINKRKLHQTENVYAKGQSKVFDDNGMYYFNSAGYLMFMDNITGRSTPVCVKPNCSHNNTSCDAYYGAWGPNIMLYDDMIFVSYYTMEYYTDSEGKEQSATKTYLECCKKDGSGRKQIYQSETGSVYAMLAVDGRLYYTAFEAPVQDVDSIDYWVTNEYLYCYNMDWGTTKKLLEYKGDYEHYNSWFYLLKSTVKDRLFLCYEYNIEPDTNESDRITEFITVDMKATLLDKKVMHPNFNLIDIQIYEDKTYIEYTDNRHDFDAESHYDIWKTDGTIESQPTIVKGVLSSLAGYYYDIIDEERKLLLDCEADKYYISKSAISDAHIVPDIVLIDKKNDVIYYDTTDYTGVADGTIFTEDPTNLSCMKWSEFLEEYFVEYEGQEIEGLTIGD